MGIQTKVVSTAMKAWVNLLSHFVVMNMYLMLKEDTMNHDVIWKEYDFIVVGGGSAGAVVASRLAEMEDFTVLLLEAGGDEPITSMVPWFHSLLPGSVLDWKFRTVPQENALWGYENQIALWPRGRVIGGTSSINTMLYIRGNRRDYDRWASEGNEGWAYEDVLPYFKRAEHQTDPILARDYTFHGTNGPLIVQNARFRTPLMKAFLKAGEELGYRVGDPNGHTQSVFSPFQMTINGGIRWSTARAYIRPMLGHKNFHVSLNSHVLKILFDNDKRATGVQYSNAGNTHEVYCRKEIVLSAGTVGSPKILMHSGVGPSQHLQKLGIDVIADLPVGRNLQDHMGVYGLSWTVKKGSAYSLLPLFNPLTLQEYKYHHTGQLAATAGVEGNAFLHSRYANSTVDWPDLQLFFLSVTPAIDGGGSFKEYFGVSTETWDTYYKPIQFREGFTIVPVLLRPYSRGYLKLRSKNPYDMPFIQPNYLSDPRDYDILLDGLKLAIKLGNTAAFKKFGAKLHTGQLPRCPNATPLSPEYWDCFIRHHATTEHHIAGTCKMGPYFDPEAVVDSKLRVHKIKGLRVADGSIMPYVVSGNTNAPIIMIGEKAADYIKQTWRTSEYSETNNIVL